MSIDARPGQCYPADSVTLAARWFDLLSWAVKAHSASWDDRTSIVRGLAALERDLEVADPSALVRREVQTLLALVTKASDDEWCVHLREVLSLAQAGHADPIVVPLLAPRSRAAVDGHRAAVEARDTRGERVHVWISPGTVVRHKSERSALDERWPQEGRLERVEGRMLHVLLVGRYHQPLQLRDAWAVDRVALASHEPVEVFERATPEDLGAFGYEAAVLGE